MGVFKKGEKKTEQQYYVSATNNQVLNYQVYIMNRGEKILVTIGLILMGGLVGLIFYGGLFKNNGEATTLTYISNAVVFGLVGLIARKMFLPVIINFLKNRRIQKLRTQFRDFLDSLSNSLSGGMNINDALLNAYEDLKLQYFDNAYIVLEVGEIIAGVQNNIPIEELLSDFGKRSSVTDIENFATVFATAYRTGGNMKSIVRRTTDIISEKMLISEEINTKLTSNKMQMQIMNVIPVFLVLTMRVSSSEFAAGFSSVIGVICMTIGVSFFILSYKLGQKIMDIKG